VGRVTFERVVKRYGTMGALEALDLDIADGEFVSLLGPSGCGKTTALRILAGLTEPTEGRVRFDGRDIVDLPPERRNIGMVFQDYALFPHMTVAENVGFGLREHRQSRARIAARVAELLALIKLPDLGQRYPSQLSGGQQQRVALARALAVGPRVLLMDEPLGALDLKLREAMQSEIQRIQRTLGVTTLYVTHDQSEAIALSDRIAVMRAGRIVQIGTPKEIYLRPRTRFVAQFVGRINLAAARLVGRDAEQLVLELAGARVAAPADSMVAGASAGTLSVAVRPEALSIASADAIGRNRVPGRIVEQSFAGNATRLLVDIGAETPWLVELPPDSAIPPAGTAISLSWPIQATTILYED
jgi:putative spermidine/putrescine transport system ATP-binding protein